MITTTDSEEFKTPSYCAYGKTSQSKARTEEQEGLVSDNRARKRPQKEQPKSRSKRKIV